MAAVVPVGEDIVGVAAVVPVGEDIVRCCNCGSCG